MAGVSSETGSKAMPVQAIGEVAAIQAAPMIVKPLRRVVRKGDLIIT